MSPLPPDTIVDTYLGSRTDDERELLAALAVLRTFDDDLVSTVFGARALDVFAILNTPPIQWLDTGGEVRYRVHDAYRTALLDVASTAQARLIRKAREDAAAFYLNRARALPLPRSFPSALEALQYQVLVDAPAAAQTLLEFAMGGLLTGHLEFVLRAAGTMRAQPHDQHDRPFAIADLVHAVASRVLAGPDDGGPDDAAIESRLAVVRPATTKLEQWLVDLAEDALGAAPDSDPPEPDPAEPDPAEPDPADGGGEEEEEEDRDSPGIDLGIQVAKRTGTRNRRPEASRVRPRTVRPPVHPDIEGTRRRHRLRPTAVVLVVMTVACLPFCAARAFIGSGDQAHPGSTPPTSSPTANLTANRTPGPAPSPTVPCGGLPTSLDVTGDRLDITVCTGPPEGFGYWLILGDRPATGPAVDYPREDLGAPLAGTYRRALTLPPTIAAAHASAAACDKCLPDRTLTVFVVRVDKTNSPQLEQYRRTDAPLPPGSTAWVQVSAEQTVP